jgi:hypothetical protein
VSPGEVEGRVAVTQAEAQRAFLLAVTHHCAVGTKP